MRVVQREREAERETPRPGMREKRKAERQTEPQREARGEREKWIRSQMRTDRKGAEPTIWGGVERSALPRAPRLRPAPLRPGREPSPGQEVRAGCRDTRPAQPVLPACAAAARSAFFPRWWRSARGDCRRGRARLAFARASTQRPPLTCAPRLCVALRRLGRSPSAAAPTCASLLPTGAEPAGGGASLGSSDPYRRAPLRSL